MSTTNRPLWYLMEQAAESVPEYMLNLDGARYAAEIRAIAEEASRRYDANDPIIAWLEIEADLAEVGE